LQDICRGIRFIPGSHTFLLLLPSSSSSSSPSWEQGLEDNNNDNALLRQAARLWWNDTLSDGEIDAQKNALDLAQWRSIRCMPSRECLCVLSSSFTAANSRVRSRFLPNYPNPVFLSQRDASLLPMDIARMLGGSHCPETFTGRTAIAPQLEADVQQHDISLCNILGLGADYIYVPYVNRLYVLVNPLGNVFLVLMSIFVVYLMIVMGHNLQVVLNVNAKAGGKKHDTEKTMKRRRGQARYLHCFCTFCGMTNTLVFAMKNIILCTGGQSHAWQVYCYSHASRPEPPTCLAPL
jgi:hypothetical protein